MTKYQNNYDAVIAMIQTSMDTQGYNYTDIEKKTGISRSQIYKWIKGEAKNIRQESFYTVAKTLNYKITRDNEGISITHHIHNQKEDTMNYNETVHAQSKTIQLLEEKVQALEAKLNSTDDTVQDRFYQTTWDDFIPHYSSVLTLDWPEDLKQLALGVFKGEIVARRIDSIDNFDIISHYLGYSVPELKKLFAVGKWYRKFSEHPIEQIITKQTTKELLKSVSMIPSLFMAQKSEINTENKPKVYATFVDYIAKDGSIVTTKTLSSINLKNKQVVAKTRFKDSYVD